MNDEWKKCPICELVLPATAEHQSGRHNLRRVECPGCGSYLLNRTESLEVINLLPDQSDRGRLSGALRANLGQEPPIHLTPELVPVLLSQAPEVEDVADKVHRLIRAIAERSKTPGRWVELSAEVDRPLAYTINTSEFVYLVLYAVEQRWLEREDSGSIEDDPAYWQETGSSVSFRLTFAGWELARQRPRLESDKAFVAMWFDQRVNEAFKLGIRQAIRNDCGFRAVRIDTEHYNGDIVDKVIAEINESRFVVADVTGHRNGVYFEAGYAMGLGIPVIWTCQASEGPATHFDAEHFNQIRWADPSDLREKLQARIRATIGRGPLEPESETEGE